MIRKLAMISFAAAVLAVFALGAHSSAAAGWDKGVKGMMDKDKVEVDMKAAPKVSTEAKGETDFKLDEKNDTLAYKIKVDDIKGVTAAHVHKVNPDGTAGEVLAPLYPAIGTGALPSGHEMGKEKKEGEFSGTLTEGRITSAQLIGSMKGKTPEDLYEMLRSGQAGVNVHTTAHPGGEIWGASKMVSKSEKDMKY